MTFPFEYRVKPTRVFNLTSGASSEGWRIEYRLPSVRRWKRFLMTADAPLAAGDFERAIAAHAEGLGG